MLLSERQMRFVLDRPIYHKLYFTRKYTIVSAKSSLRREKVVYQEPFAWELSL